MGPQPPRRAHGDMAPGGQRPRLPPYVHAADAGGDARPSIQPRQLRLHLQRQLPRGRDGQRHRRPRRGQLAPRHEGGGGGKAERHRLAGAGAGRHQQIPLRGLGLQDGRLDGGRLQVLARSERRVEHWVDRREGHGRDLGLARALRQGRQRQASKLHGPVCYTN